MLSTDGKATVLWRDFFKLDKPQIRAFHMSWFAFFLCFFAWFGIAPLMIVIKEELSLTAAQVGNTIIASVAFTIVGRLFIGWLCDRIGPRLSYTWLLVLGSIPVLGIGLSQSYESFLIFRLLIGLIGASFVITQTHTSLMFAPNVVGTANATSAGWGNLGGGATNLVMPLIYGLLFSVLGFSSAVSWRLAMVLAGILCLLTGIAYYKFTQDTPQGNFADIRKSGKNKLAKPTGATFFNVCKDFRVWVLFVVYACCFGLELTMLNVLSLYFQSKFELTLSVAGAIAGSFGLMNLFARTLGGTLGDKFGKRFGIQGRVHWLFAALFFEAIALMFFSQMQVFWLAVVVLLMFSLFVQMAEGATFAVVPFVNRESVGSVSGIVGAGGNLGAVLAGFLFKTEVAFWQNNFLYLGLAVLGCAFVTLTIRFSAETESKPVTQSPSPDIQLATVGNK